MVAPWGRRPACQVPRPGGTLAGSPAEVKATRELLGASQAIFAQFLGVSASAVQDWEQGAKPPQGSACRLMHEIRRDPAYWRKRLVELAEFV